MLGPTPQATSAATRRSGHGFDDRRRGGPQGGSGPAHRARAVRRRHPPAGHAAHGVRAQPPRPRAHRLDRHVRSGRAARRARRVDPRRPTGPAAEPVAPRHRAAVPGHGEGALRRRAHRRGRRHRPLPRRRRRRGRGRRLRATARDGLDRGGDRRGRHADPRRPPVQRRPGAAALRRRRRGRARRRAAPARDPPAQPAVRRGADGAHRVHRRLAVRQPHPLRDHADPAPPAQRARADARALAAGGAGHRAGRRRRLRREGVVLPRVPAHRGAVATAAAPGQVRRDPQREHDRDGPRPRPGAGHRGRLRRRGPPPRAAGADHAGLRRLAGPGRRRAADAHLVHVRRLLQDPEDRAELPVGRHQHHAGRRLPRRGAARGVVPHRAGDRPRRRGAGHRPARRPAPQLHPARRDALPHPVRGHRLRRGELPRRARDAAAPRRRRRTAQGPGRPPRGPVGPAAGHRLLDVRRDGRLRPHAAVRAVRLRRRLGVGQRPAQRRRLGGGQGRHQPARSGPPDDVRPDRRRRAADPLRAHHAHARRHRDRPGGHRHDGQPGHPRRRLGGAEGGGQGAGQGAADRRAHAGGRRERPRARRRALRRQGRPRPGREHGRGRAARVQAAPAARGLRPRPRRDRVPRAVEPVLPVRGALLRGRDRPRHRDGSMSCATSRSTTAAS